MQDELNSIVALDLGSSQIKVVVGRPIKENVLEIIGKGTSVSSGIKNGAIINIETTVRSIREAISQAELMAGISISDVIVNISGKTIKAGNHKNVVAITNRERIVTEEDIQRVVDAILSTTVVPSDQEIIHVLSKEFAVDDQPNIKEPLGMTGVRLEGEAHIVSCGITSIDKVLSSFASSEAVLTSSEKELGTVVVDIGAGITDIVIFIEGGVAYSSVIPFGGNNITNDLSIGLKTSVEIAESIKRKYGSVQRVGIDPTEKIEIPAVNNRPSRVIHRETLVAIIEPRVHEILEHINYELEKSGKKTFLAGGVILTGGSSLIGGIEILAEEILGLSVSRAKPAGLTGLYEHVSTPEFSTAVGLIKYLARSTEYEVNNPQTKWIVNSDEKKGIARKIWRWMENNL